MRKLLKKVNQAGGDMTVWCDEMQFHGITLLGSNQGSRGIVQRLRSRASVTSLIKISPASRGAECMTRRFRRLAVDASFHRENAHLCDAVWERCLVVSG